MGIKLINSYMMKSSNSGIKRVTLKKYTRKVVVIDVSNFLFRYLYSQGDRYLLGFLMIFQHLLKNEIYPIFCFDGLPPKEKAKTLKKRQVAIRKRIKRIDEVNGALQILDSILDKKFYEFLSFSPTPDSICENIGDQKTNHEYLYELLLNGIEPEFSKITIDEIEILQKKFQAELAKNNQKCTKITKIIIENLKKMFDILDIKYIHSKDTYEADLLCSIMVKKGFAEIAISDDLDMLPLGCCKTLRGFTYDCKEQPLEYDLEEIIRSLKFKNIDYLINLCLICGTDYTSKISQIKNTNDLEQIITEMINIGDPDSAMKNLINNNSHNQSIDQTSSESDDDINNQSYDVSEYEKGKEFFKNDYLLGEIIQEHNLDKNTCDINYLDVFSFVKNHSKTYNPNLLSEIIKKIKENYTDDYRQKFQTIIDEKEFLNHCSEKNDEYSE